MTSTLGRATPQCHPGFAPATHANGAMVTFGSNRGPQQVRLNE